jgi:SAM-dependent methyltransferase
MPQRLNILEQSAYRYRAIKRRIIATYDSLLIRMYCLVRFLIIPMRMMDSIGQFVPERGTVLDLGCGFGLFTLYYAMTHPEARFVGVDLSDRRIALARNSARKLGLSNVEFLQGDARAAVRHMQQRFNLVFSIDLFHHIPYADGDALAQSIHDQLLGADGAWVLKDVSTKPRAMLYFTFLLDWLMNPRDAFFYRNLSVWKANARNIGYASVETFEVWDVLPYPHFLLVARKSGGEGQRR